MLLLLTTELGVLDASSRISADIVKVNYLRDNDRWSVSRLYFFFCGVRFLLGSAILLIVTKEPLMQLRTAAALNGTFHVPVFAAAAVISTRKFCRAACRSRRRGS